MNEEVKDETIEQQETKTTFTKEEVDALVSGLKANNEKLLSEKKAAAAAAKEAAAAKLKAEQERAKQNGELEAFEKTLRSQYEPVLAEKDGKISKMAERILGAERRSVISQLSGMLIDESAADIIAMMVKTEFDGDDVVTKFTGADGNVITTDAEQFKKYLREHKAFSHLIKADAATGGGASGNKNSTGGAGGTDVIQQKLNAKYGKRG